MNEQNNSKESQQSGDDGFSLPELLVTVFLFGVAMTLIVSLFVSFTTVFNREKENTGNANQAAQMMNSAVRAIRAGTTLGPVASGEQERPAFVAAKPNQLVFYSNLSDHSDELKPIRIRIFVDASNRLIEDRWNPSSTASPWTYPPITSKPSSTRTLGTGLVGDKVVFAYRKHDGSVLPSSMSSAELGTISTVVVTITTTSGSGRAGNFALSNEVRLPNLRPAKLGL